MTALIEWCNPQDLDTVPCQRAAWRDWLGELSARVATLPAASLDATDNGMTALGLLAMNRGNRDLATEGARVLLAAGANPLAGSPAVEWTPGFIDESRMAQMFLEAAATAECSGTPYRADNGGNLLHVLAHNGLGWLSALSQDPPAAHAAALSAWLGQGLPADGNTPLHLVWQIQFDRWKQDRSLYEGMTSAMWVASTPRAGWPVDLLRANHAGTPIFQLMAQARTQGMPLGDEGQAAWLQVQALLEQDSLEDRTAPAPSRLRPFQGRL